MTKPHSDSYASHGLKRSIDNERLARLKAEAKAPFRGLRQFIYVACATSAFIGGFIFFFQLLAGQEVGSSLPNFALQAGTFALMVWLFRLEQRKSQK
jgi:hypothetical protein